jgi:hypothetical protein
MSMKSCARFQSEYQENTARLAAHLGAKGYAVRRETGIGQQAAEA